MNQEIDLMIKKGYEDDYRDGYPLITKESISNWDASIKEGSVVNLVDAKKSFVVRGYYGRQNKGYGWVLSSDKNEAIDEDFFIKKMREAKSYREDLYADTQTTAFRFFNGEGDGVGGLTIDYFDGYYLMTWYSLGIYEFREQIVDALKKSVDFKGIYQKKRFDSKGKYLDESDDFICGKKAPEPLIVKENGVKFAIYLDDGAMVGVFLDQREVRKTIRDSYVKGRSFLNTFSYTGAFSIFASLGGATKTTSVDLAKRSLPKTREHFSLNNIDVDAQDIVVEDVFNYFKYAVRKKLLFDMVVLDPPSFARSKKRTFSASKNYVELLIDAIKITSKGGVIVASTNSANFSMMTFRDFIKRAFREVKGRFEVIESFTLPKDFRVNPKFKEGDYLKVVFIKKL